MAKAKAVAADLKKREAFSIDFSFTLNPIIPLLIVGLLLRLILATLPAFAIDIGTFQAWSHQLAQDGPWNFYDTDFFTDYAPGYLYVLWAVGELDQALTFGPDTWQYVLKLPSVIADVASAYLLYRLLEGQKPGVRLGATAIYLLFPAALFIGPVWGQVDSLLAFFLLLSIYFLARDRPVEAALAFTVGFLIKPQGIAALPFLAFWVMRSYPPRVWLQTAGVGTVAGLLLIAPFFTYKPWELYDQLRFSADVYPYNSFFAYNFWAMFEWFKPDNTQFLGFSYQVWGLMLFAVTTVVILFSLRRSQGAGALALGTALCMVAFYMLVTRMHERYLFPALLPLLAACVLTQSRLLWAAFGVLGAVHFLNLYHAYANYNENELRVEDFLRWFQDGSFLGIGLNTVQVLSILIFAAFAALLAIAYLRESGYLRENGTSRQAEAT